MNITELSNLVKLNLSQREIAEQLNTSQTNIRYWLKKHNLTTKKVISKVDTRFCPCCKNNLPLQNFYARRSKESSSTYCKLCTTAQTLTRQRKLKAQAIEYKGRKMFNM